MFTARTQACFSFLQSFLQRITSVICLRRLLKKFYIYVGLLQQGTIYGRFIYWLPTAVFAHNASLWKWTRNCRATNQEIKLGEKEGGRRETSSNESWRQLPLFVKSSNSIIIPLSIQKNTRCSFYCAENSCRIQQVRLIPYVFQLKTPIILLHAF